MTSLFLDNNRQHMLVCGKVISSWISKILSISKTYMLLCTVQGSSACAA